MNYTGGSSSAVIRLTLSSLLLGEYAAATVLISFCVVLGKLSSLQLIIMAVLEVGHSHPLRDHQTELCLRFSCTLLTSTLGSL